MDDLIPSERRVVLLLVQGHNNESIASQLDITSSTVKRHVWNITTKLGVNSSREVAFWYYRTHWQPKPHPIE